MSEVRVRSKQWHYHTSVTWLGEGKAKLSCEGMPDLTMSPPANLGGPSGFWTPEDLLVASVETCVLLTFLYFADQQGIELVEYTSRAEGTLESSPEGMSFTAFTVRPRIVVREGQVEAARAAIAKADERCLVTRSLKPGVALEAEVVAG
jgi:organic hydroperoxide reductase OsmC/OhrA